MVEHEDVGVLAGGEAHRDLVAGGKGGADDGVAGEADTLDPVGQAVPYAEGVALVVHVAEYNEAAVERPRRGHGDAGDIGDLAEVAAGGFGDPHVALVLAAVLHEGERGEEEVAVAGEGLHEVGAEAVGHILHFFFGYAAVSVAEHELSGKGFIDAQLHCGPGLVALRPAGGDEQVRARKLEALEVDVRGLVAGEGRTAEDSFGIRQPHEGQEAQVVMDGGVELLAKPLGRLTGAERGGHGQIDDVLTGPVDVDLHGGF